MAELTLVNRKELQLIRCEFKCGIKGISKCGGPGFAINIAAASKLTVSYLPRIAGA